MRPLHHGSPFTGHAHAGMLAPMMRIAPWLLLAFAPLLMAQEPADRIWSSAAAAFVDDEALRDALAGADIVLLGEIHDNARHHRLQARMIEWTAAGRPSGVVLEMLGPEQADALAAWRQAPAPDPSDLGPAVGWEETGWPDWSLYQPVAEAALAAGIDLHAGAPGRDELRRVVRAGLQTLGDDGLARLGLDRDLPASARQRLNERLEQAHCGITDHLPVERMIDAQRLRDATMSRALLDVHARTGSAILIAGNAHVRRDYGVPRYIEQLAGDLEVVTVGLVPAKDLAADADGAPDHPASSAFDFAWFTRATTPVATCGDDARAPG